MSIKVNIKTTRFFIGISLFCLMVGLAYFMLQVNTVQVNSSILYAFYFFSFIAVITTYFYLICVLRDVHESSSIITAFIVALIYSIIKFVLPFLLGKQSNSMIELYFNYLFVVIIRTYVLINIFRIRNQVLAPPFKLFGIIGLSVIVLKILSPFLHLPGKFLREAFNLLELLPLVAVIFILFKVITFLNSEKKPLGLFTIDKSL
ncbi:hypothetical protein [Mucilaginibacter sp. NFX135]|uniref:hypothetical protein n=1 Tax=Mucilaginibacter sp. NFX135 TaxID=3402687 RepID=UPI003AFAEF1A